MAMKDWLSSIEKKNSGYFKKIKGEVSDENDLFVDTQTDPLTQLISNLKGSEKPNQWIDDYNSFLAQSRAMAEATGKWNQSQLLSDWGVEPGSPYVKTNPEDRIPLVVQDPGTGKPVQMNQGQYNQMKKSLEAQTMMDEQARTQGIQEIADLFGLSNTPPETDAKSFAEQVYDMLGNKDTDLAFQTLGELSDKEKANYGVSGEAYNRVKNVLSAGKGNFSSSPSFDDFLDATFGTETQRKVQNHVKDLVPVINQWANALYKQGDIPTLVKFVKESGMGPDNTFSTEEAMNAFMWIFNHSDDNDFRERYRETAGLFSGLLAPDLRDFKPSSGARFVPVK